MRRHFLLLTTILVLLGVTMVDAFRRSKQSQWLHDYLVSNGVSELIASAALDGMTEEDIGDVGHFEAIVLKKTLLVIEQTLEDAKHLTSIVPGSAHSAEKMAQFVADHSRRSIELIFDTMEGRIKKHMPWHKASKNLHSFINKEVCKPLKKHHLDVCHPAHELIHPVQSVKKLIGIGSGEDNE